MPAADVPAGAGGAGRCWRLVSTTRTPACGRVSTIRRRRQRLALREQRLDDAADAHADLLAVDDEHRELGKIEPGLQRRDQLRERQRS